MVSVGGLPPQGSGGGGSDNVANVNRGSRTAGDVTTTSTSLVDLTGMTFTPTSTGGHFLCILSSSGFCNSAGNVAGWDLNVAGSGVGGTRGLFQVEQQVDTNVSFSHITAAQAAGAVTIKVQWLVTAGTGTTRASATIPCLFQIMELKD